MMGLNVALLSLPSLTSLTLSASTIPPQALRRPGTAKIIGCGLICLLLTTVAIIAATTTVLERDFRARAASRTDCNMRIAWHVLDEFGGTFRIADGKLYAGSTPLDGNTSVINEIQALTGGVVTIFRGDQRVATDVPRQGGGLATGTRLATNAAWETVLEQHRPYRGTIDILGETYAAAYDPITDEAGHVIGILFVGTSEADTLAAINRVRTVLFASSASVLILVSLGFLIFSRRIARQVSARERALAEANHRLDTALENMKQGLCYFNGEGRLIMASARFMEMYGLSKEQAPPGTSLARIVTLRAQAGAAPKMSNNDYLAWRREVSAAGRPQDTVVELEDGRFIAIHHRPMPDGGWVATHDDITSNRRAEAETRFMARHDALTKLGNRILFRERLEQLRERGETCAVISLDLDRFKEVNDTLGHPVGDMLLQAVAGRLANAVRGSDTVTRLGGDEFAVICTPVRAQADITGLAQRLIVGISDPYQLAGQQVVIGTSIGIAFAEHPTDDYEMLLRNSDLALYRAKSESRGAWRVFQPDMGEQARDRRELESDLRHALANEEFVVFYQPLVDLRTGLVSGFEALLRWPHPTRGMVPPCTFVELAESSGLIVPLGAWVLRRAVTDAAGWPAHLKVSVNLSTLQFGPHLFQTASSALESAGLAPERLELEITETALLKKSDTVMSTLFQLREHGIRIVLDDFGTGFSSLSYLLKFPFDKIKLDHSFVHGIGERPASAAILRAVSGLARGIGVELLAEGVETEAQLDWLRREGFDEAQGHLFSAALPAAEVSNMLADVEGTREGQGALPPAPPLRAEP